MIKIALSSSRIFVRALIISAIFWSAVCGSAMAQENPVPPATPTDVQSIDRVLMLLKDDASRAALVGNLEALRKSVGQVDATVDATAGKPAEAPADGQPGDNAILTDTGLMGAIAGWVVDIGRKLPSAALGAPINVKFAQAGQQLQTRLETGTATSLLQDFLIRSAPGWVGAALIAFILSRLLRSRVQGRIASRSGMAMLRDAALRAALTLLPIMAATAFIIIYAQIIGFQAGQAPVFALLATPLLVGKAASGLLSCALILLAPTRGWRLVVYAQKRLSPWIGIMVAFGVASSVSVSPMIRLTIGWAAGDILSLVLDLCVAVIALVTVIRHRNTVRSLIVKRGRVAEARRDTILQRSIIRLADNWHRLAYIFIALNVGARLFGTGSGSFLTQAVVSVVLVTLAVMSVATIEGGYEGYSNRLRRRWRPGTRDTVVLRVGRILKEASQVLIFVAVAGLCVSLWGFNLLAWLHSDIGLAIMGPVFAIAIVLLTAWVIWISLDSWIEGTLTATDSSGRIRNRSARIKTLLPLIRNFAFVVLTVLTIIAVLANLGVNVAPLLAGAGVVGLAIGFGSQQLVQDVITGLFILLEDTIAIGDVVDTGDRAGTVEALTIRTVKIRDGDGALHSIPFSSVKALKNRSRDFGVYTVAISIDPKADVGKAIEALSDVGDDVAKDPRYASNILAPLEVWGVDQLGPDGVVIKGAVRTRPLQQWGVGREINRRVKLRLDELGIALANPGVITVETAAASANAS